MNLSRIKHVLSNKYTLIATVAFTWISTLLLALSALTTMFGHIYYTTNSIKVIGGTNPYSYGYLYTAHPYNLDFSVLTAIAIVLLSISLFLYHRR